MEHLGNINLFTYHFTLGCRESSLNFTKTYTNHIESLHKWIDFKNNDWGMERYKTDRTQFICYLEIIPIESLKEIINDLLKIYKKSYPFSKYDDFLEYIFGYTIFELEQIIEFNLTWISEPPNETEFTYFNYYSHPDLEFLDFGIDINKDIENYKQYYRLVLEILNEPIQKTYEISNKSNNKYNFPELLDTEFNNPIHYEVFKKLTLNFAESDKKKWSIIFDFLTTEYKPKMIISQSKYFSFINKYLVNEKITERRQPSVKSEDYFKILSDILRE